jgi:serine/threonine-protein kinase SRPK3
MAFTADRLSHMTKESLFEVLGLPYSEELTRSDGNPIVAGIPKYIVKSATWDGWVNNDKDNFRLLDFGESFVQGEEPEIITQPAALMGPETILTEVFDYKLDLWRVGLAVSLTFLIASGRTMPMLILWVGSSILSCLEDSHSTALGTEIHWLCK